MTKPRPSLTERGIASKMRSTHTWGAEVYVQRCGASALCPQARVVYNAEGNDIINQGVHAKAVLTFGGAN